MSEFKNKNDEQSEKTKLAEDIASKSKRVSRSYAGFELSFIRFFRFLSSLVDKMLFNNRYLVVSSLVLAIVLVSALNFGDAQVLSSNKSADIIENIKVQTMVNTEIYEVKGVPDIVSAVLIGEISDLQMIQSSNNISVVADLSGLGEGTHQVVLRPINYSAKIEVRVDPATALVTIARKMSKAYYFTYEFINTDKADAMYYFGTPTFSTDQIFVRASQATLDEIAQVKALIDVRGITSDFTQEATLVAYDQQGERLEVDIMPEKVETTVLVSVPSKVVPIEIQPIGDIPNNKSIASVTLDHQSITIYAAGAILDKITSVVIPVDVSNLIEDETQGTARVTLPSGIRKADVDNIHFTIKTGELKTRRIEGVKLEYTNYDDQNFVFTVVHPGDTNVEVILSGTKENIDEIQADQIRAYIDLSSIKVGNLSVPIIVTGPSYLVRYNAVKEVIDIRVEEKK